MANARDFDGTGLSAAHIGPELADMYGAMKDGSPTTAKGTAVMTLVDGTPDLDGNTDITGSLTVGTGATVTAGGLTVTAGGATVTAGGLTVSAGASSVQALTLAGELDLGDQNIVNAKTITSHASSHLTLNAQQQLKIQKGGVDKIHINATGIGFLGASPVAQQADCGVGGDAAANEASIILIRTCLRNLGLMA